MLAIIFRHSGDILSLWKASLKAAARRILRKSIGSLGLDIRVFNRTICRHDENFSFAATWVKTLDIHRAVAADFFKVYKKIRVVLVLLNEGVRQRMSFVSGSGLISVGLPNNAPKIRITEPLRGGRCQIHTKPRSLPVCGPLGFSWQHICR